MQQIVAQDNSGGDLRVLGEHLFLIVCLAVNDTFRLRVVVQSGLKSHTHFIRYTQQLKQSRCTVTNNITNCSPEVFAYVVR